MKVTTKETHHQAMMLKLSKVEDIDIIFALSLLANSTIASQERLTQEETNLSTEEWRDLRANIAKLMLTILKAEKMSK